MSSVHACNAMQGPAAAVCFGMEFGLKGFMVYIARTAGVASGDDWPLVTTMQSSSSSAASRKVQHHMDAQSFMVARNYGHAAKKVARIGGGRRGRGKSDPTSIDQAI